MEADYRICSNGHRSYSYFQVRKDTASTSQGDEASVSTALCMDTRSTRQCGLSFWERLRRLERLSAIYILHKLSQMVWPFCY